MAITEKQKEALIIMSQHTQLSVRAFSEKFWPDSNMHTKVSNQGNGATAGKAAWLCGGSYLSKLEIKGWVKKAFWDENGNENGISVYQITELGRSLIV